MRFDDILHPNEYLIPVNAVVLPGDMWSLNHPDLRGQWELRSQDGRPQMFEVDFPFVGRFCPGDGRLADSAARLAYPVTSSHWLSLQKHKEILPSRPELGLSKTCLFN